MGAAETFLLVRVQQACVRYTYHSCLMRGSPHRMNRMMMRRRNSPG
jgi:hypothetical protein